jgi:hypothetical protein
LAYDAVFKFVAPSSHANIINNVNVMKKLTDQILENVYNVRELEDKTSDLTGLNLKRLTFISAVSIAVIVLISFWEVFYLKKYFVQQKVA